MGADKLFDVNFDAKLGEPSDGIFLLSLYDCCRKHYEVPLTCAQHFFQITFGGGLIELIEPLLIIIKRYEHTRELVPEIDKYLKLKPLISFGTRLQTHEGQTALFNGHFFVVLYEGCGKTSEVA